jgi:integrase/recombinase XerD
MEYVARSKAARSATRGDVRSHSRKSASVIDVSALTGCQNTSFVTAAEQALFLTRLGDPFTPDALTDRVRKVVSESGVGKKSACHMFRHTTATLMLEGGADIRYVQQMLGHSKLETTEIYTHVSITKLREVHAATHPAAKLGRSPAAVIAREDAAGRAEAAELLVALVDEAEDDHDPEANAEELPSTTRLRRSTLR